MMFGGSPAILTVRPRGDTGRLPVELDISTSVGSALPKIIIGAIFAVLGFNMLGGVVGGADFGPIIALVFQAVPYVLLLAGLFVFVRGVIGLADRRTARFEDGKVTVSGKSFLRSESWTEPLSAFEGVRWREIVVQNRSRNSGNNRTRRDPRVYQVLDLKHPDPARCIPLYVTRLSESSNAKLKGLMEALDASDDPRARAAPLRKLAGDIEEGTRPKWEHFAKLLGVPAIDARGGDAEVREVQDLDKSVKELATEGKVRVEWDDSAPPPPGLELTHEGDPADPSSQALLVTIHARRHPLWLYGVLMAVSAVLLLLGISDLALMPVLFGAGLGAGVAWHWRSEARNPRTLRITRTELELNTPNPGNKPTHSVIRHSDIETVRITRRHDRSVIGPQLAIETDQGEHNTGAGLSKAGQEWLRDLILSAIAKA